MYIKCSIFAASLYLAHGAWAQNVNDSNLSITPYLSGLDQPTGIRFFGNDQGFVINKTGTVNYFNHGVVSNALTLNVNTASERGLLGITLDPNFSINKSVYLYHSVAATNGDWLENRLTRYTWNGNNLVTPVTLASFGSSADAQANGPNHNGGPLIFGNDGKIYGVTGDLNRNGVEQNNQSTNVSSHVGGVYRLNPDGSTPADNPFSGEFAQWYAYGVRNSFGIAKDPVTGKIWDTENGPDAYDEINLVTPGMNSGWNQVMGPDARDPQNAPNDLNMLPGAHYQDPKFSFQAPIGITSIQFLNGSNWGTAYDNAVLVGDNNGSRLWLLRLNAQRDGFLLSGDTADGVLDSGDTMTAFGNGFGIPTDIQVGPDGDVYVVSLANNNVYRLAPVPEPQTWMLMLGGLGIIGSFLRRKFLAA